MLKSRITNSCECDTHYWYFQNKPLQCHCIETVSAFAAETCVVVSADKKKMYTHVAGISNILRMKDLCIDCLVHEIKTKLIIIVTFLFSFLLVVAADL